MRKKVDQLEREAIATVPAEYKGRIQQTAKVPGLTRKGLKDKMARYGIKAEPS